MDRWSRLERYAMWKQRRFALLHLPHELLEYVCRAFLETPDVRNLLTALAGRSFDYDDARVLRALPAQLHAHYVFADAQCRLEEYLYGLSDHCLYLALSCAVVRVFIDWSPFASYQPPYSVAEYGWCARSAPHTRVTVHRTAVLCALMVGNVRQRPCGYLTVYRCFTDGRGKIHLGTKPSYQTSVRLFPAWTLDEDVDQRIHLTRHGSRLLKRCLTA
jgi:hypothetical protein